MATLTRHDRRAIVFNTVGDEWPLLDLFLMGAGILFTIVGIYELRRTDWSPLARNPWLWLDPSWILGLLFVLAFIAVGITVCALSFLPIFKSEKLRIDLLSRTYRCRRGLLFWGERFRGSIDDFDHIEAADRPYDRGDGHLSWVVEFVWRCDRHRPFRVDHWIRTKSFQLDRPRADRDRSIIQRTLDEISKEMRLPLLRAATRVEPPSLADAEIDAWRVA